MESFLTEAFVSEIKCAFRSDPGRLLPGWHEHEDGKTNERRIFSAKPGQRDQVAFLNLGVQPGVHIADITDRSMLQIGKRHVDDSLFINDGALAPENMGLNPEVSHLIHTLASVYEGVRGELKECIGMETAGVKGKETCDININMPIRELLAGSKGVSATSFRHRFSPHRDVFDLELEGQGFHRAIRAALEVREKSANTVIQKVDFAPVPVNLSIDVLLNMIKAKAEAAMKSASSAV